MIDICHPVYYNMSQLGCTDQIKLTTAFYVYMELCEVKRYWDVEYKYCESLQLFYLEAKKSKNGTIETFIPWPAIQNINLDFISNIQDELKKEKFTFIFKEGDTTSVYYSISEGLVKPITPEESKLIKEKEERKYELEKEISRNTVHLYERALLLDNDSEGILSCSRSMMQEETDTENFFTPQIIESEQMNSLALNDSNITDFTDSNITDSTDFENKLLNGSVSDKEENKIKAPDECKSAK